MQIVNVRPHIETYFKIYNTNKELVPFILWLRQNEAADMLHGRWAQDASGQWYCVVDASLWNLFLKSRQSGFSTLIGANAIGQCMYQKDFVSITLSVTGADADEFLFRAWTLYDKQEDKHKMLFPIKTKRLNEIMFENGSRMISLPVNRGYGFTADQVNLDEFFKINRTRSKIGIVEVFNNIKPIVDKREGQINLIGTADGMNEQQELYERSARGETQYKTLFFSCFDDPTMTIERREREAGLLPDPTQLNQEYPRTPEEAFLSSGRPRFDMEKLLRIPTYIRLLDVQISAVPDMEIYAHLKEDGNYATISDVAEGLEKGDESTLKVKDRMTGDTVALWHGKVEPHILGNMAVAVATYYNMALIVVERNNHGLATLTQITQVHKYPEDKIFRHDVFRDDSPDKQISSPVKRFGWLTTPGIGGTRQPIIDSLGMAVFNETIKMLPADTKKQMTTFVTKANGKVEADGSYLDDLVITEAIANYLFVDMAEMVNSFYPLNVKMVLPRKHITEINYDRAVQENLDRAEAEAEGFDNSGGVDMGVMYDEF